MKNIPTFAGLLLGLLFIVFGLNHFFSFFKLSSPPPANAEATGQFFTSIVSTGYLDFIKVFEILGGLLVAIPKTRNFGLLILGPIVINIIAINHYVRGGDAVFAWPVLLVSVLALYLLIIESRKFAKLLK